MRSATALKNRGFTLIELLLALTIVTILAVSVFVALNPAQRLKDSKDARRSADVDTILTAIHQSIVDNKGTYPTRMPAVNELHQIGTPNGDVINCPATAVGTYCAAAGSGILAGWTAGCADLIEDVSQDLIPYLKNMPIDPNGTSLSTKTGYAVKRDSNGIVSVVACYTDAATVISASR